MQDSAGSGRDRMPGHTGAHRYYMDGYKFEKRCAAMLRRQGFTHVTLTGGSGDQGIDITARKHRKKYGIQCKYYHRPVGNKAVQEAYAGARYHECDVAAVMTNSTYTEAARALAESTGVRLWHAQARGFGCWKHLWWVSLSGIILLAAMFWLLLPWCVPASLEQIRRLYAAAGQDISDLAVMLPHDLIRLRMWECLLAAGGSFLCFRNRRSRILLAAAELLAFSAIGCELVFRDRTLYSDAAVIWLLLGIAGTAAAGLLYLRICRRREILEEDVPGQPAAVQGTPERNAAEQDA